MRKLYDKLFYWGIYCSVVFNQMTDDAVEKLEKLKRDIRNK